MDSVEDPGEQICLRVYAHATSNSETIGHVDPPCIVINEAPADIEPPSAVATIKNGYGNPITQATASQRTFLTHDASLDPQGQALTATWALNSWTTRQDPTDHLWGNEFDVPGWAQIGDRFSFTLTVQNEAGLTDTDTATLTVIPYTPNNPPVADAGVDQTVGTGSTVMLDAGRSSDAETPKSKLKYHWTQHYGPTVQLSDDRAVRPTFTAPDYHEQIGFVLYVEDEASGSEPIKWSEDEVVINVVVKGLPTVSAGSGRTVERGETVSITGSVTGGAFPPFTYDWWWVQVPTTGRGEASKTIPLQGTDTKTVTFTVPENAEEGDTHILAFEVTDSRGNSAFEYAQIMVAVSPAPTVDAGSAQHVDAGATVTLSGSASGSNSLSYQWYQDSGPSVQLSDAQSASPTFTAPDTDGGATLTFRLRVTDQNGKYAEDTVDIYVYAGAQDTGAMGSSDEEPDAQELLNSIVATLTAIAQNYDSSQTEVAITVNGDTITIVVSPAD